MKGGEGIPVNPAVLRWLRQESGITEDAAALRTKTSAAEVARWERGEQEPSLAQLKTLAALYRRPLAAFLLPTPKPMRLPHDFRVGLEADSDGFTRQTLTGLRHASWLHDVAKELVELASFRAGVRGCSITDDPADVASRERSSFGVTPTDIAEARSDHEAFRLWREVLEAEGIFVFQVSMEKDEVRGCSFLESAPAIVVNSSDYIRSRIFTLFHEYAHLLLGDTGLCNPHPRPLEPRVEAFCNAFATAFLVPNEDLTARAGRILESEGPPDDRLFGSLISRFKVSKGVIWYRLYQLGLIADSTFDAKWAEWRSTPLAPPSTGGPQLTTPERRLLERGRRFVGLVVDAERSGALNHAGALTALGVSSQVFDSLVSAVDA